MSGHRCITTVANGKGLLKPCQDQRAYLEREGPFSGLVEGLQFEGEILRKGIL